MRWRTVCILFCTYIYLLQACAVYIDAQEGNDRPGCGTEGSPCQTIGTHKSVCISPGTYTTNTSIPALISKPRIECIAGPPSTFGVYQELNGNGGPIAWNFISVSGCLLEVFNASDITLQNVSLSDCNIFQSWNDDLISSTSIIDCDFNNNKISLLPMQSDSIHIVRNHIWNETEFIVGSIGTRLPEQHITHNTIEEGSGMLISNQVDTASTIYSILVHQNTGGGNLSVLWSAGPIGHLNSSLFNISHNDLRLVTHFEQLYGTKIHISHNRNYLSVTMDTPSVSDVYIYDNVLDTAVLRNTKCIMDTSHRVLRFYFNDNTIDFLEHSGCSSDLTEWTARNNRFKQTILSIQSSFFDADDHPPSINATVVENQWSYGGNVTAFSIQNAYSATILVANNSIAGYDSPSGAGGISITNLDYGLGVSIECCKATSGGAIAVMATNSKILIENNVMNYNEASLDSGALSVTGSNENVTVCGNIMNQNKAPHASVFTIGDAKYVDITDNVIVIYSRPSYNADDTVAVSGRPISIQNQLYCPPGTQLRVDVNTHPYVWACSFCEDGRYMLGAGKLEDEIFRDTACQICPSNLDCSVGKPPMADPGYWCGRSSTDREQLVCYDCPSNHCNSTSHPWSDSCETGRKGVLCGECQDGYTLGFLTSKCMRQTQCHGGYATFIAFAPFVYVALLLVLPIGDGSIWKSISFFVQTFPLLIQRRHFDGFRMVLSFAITPESNDLSTGVGFCIGNVDYLQREALCLYIPLATVFLLAVACLVAKAYEKITGRRKLSDEEKEERKKKKGRSRYSRCSTALITSLLLVYTGVTSICLKILFCVQIETEEKSGWVMYNAGSIECSGTWRKVFVAVAAVTLLPSPFFILYFRHRLKKGRSRTTRDMLMVLDGCYRNGCKYWETIYMLRRLLVAVVYVLGAYSKWTGNIMRALAILSLASHLILRPFQTKSGQALETICLLSLTLLTSLDGMQQPERIVPIEIILIAIPFLFSAFLMSRKTITKLYRLIQRKRSKNHPSQLTPSSLDSTPLLSSTEDN
ncbi:hypothetical protein PROFUN_14083 [Planoprotostelium fungivorum]|uniref:Right handed beta helix domain-containing protein n=1 Tax=Planoprotostelium fungivorum TaxID=1890364 RepID=A0A2P6N225_9EUKA|nr:hypothetical protein PROFUN_14083 [Planoprotostelium fungivorum]